MVMIGGRFCGNLGEIWGQLKVIFNGNADYSMDTNVEGYGGFLVSCFRGFLVSWFLGFLASWFLGFLFSDR